MDPRLDKSLHRYARRLARMGGTGVAVEDLVQSGWEGVLGAQLDFDPEKGVPFLAYARKRAWWAMLNELRRNGLRKRTRAQAPLMLLLSDVVPEDMAHHDWCGFRMYDEHGEDELLRSRYVDEARRLPVPEKPKEARPERLPTPGETFRPLEGMMRRRAGRASRQDGGWPQARLAILAATFAAIVEAIHG